MTTSRLRVALLIVLSAIGAVTFFWPFLLPAARPVVASLQEHWWGVAVMILVLGAPLVAILFIELGRGGMGTKAVALIGVLGGTMVALRLPGYIGGFNAIFIVPVLAGNAFGPAFGFTLGAVGMMASGIFTGGVGPWLPYQMVAMGWVGMGAGFLPKRSPKRRIGSLAAYAIVVGFLFGAIMNLQFWPLAASGSAIDWVPDGSVAQNLAHYAAFYASTSFGWDLFLSVGLATSVLILGRPLLASLDRAARRMRLDLSPIPATDEPAPRRRRPLRTRVATDDLPPATTPSTADPSGNPAPAR